MDGCRAFQEESDYGRVIFLIADIESTYDNFAQRESVGFGWC